MAKTKYLADFSRFCWQKFQHVKCDEAVTGNSAQNLARIFGFSFLTAFLNIFIQQLGVYSNSVRSKLHLKIRKLKSHKFA